MQEEGQKIGQPSDTPSSNQEEQELNSLQDTGLQHINSSTLLTNTTLDASAFINQMENKIELSAEERITQRLTK